MKTAISLPDDLFESADTLANELGVSRSELYAQAVAEFVAKHRQGDVTAQLNKIYETATAGMHPKVRNAQARSLNASEW